LYSNAEGYGPNPANLLTPRISFQLDLLGQRNKMSTAERIVWGLLSFIALIAWLRWEGTPEDQKKDEPPVPAE
jgi:hypothetical protein